jgi:betaine-aldehyde dehydrogenase
MTRSNAVDALADSRMFVGGAWTASSDGSTLESVDPTTEEVIATFPNATGEDVDLAVQAGMKGLDGWRDMAPSARGKVLMKWADRIDAHAEELAEIDTVDVGNPIAAMRNDVAGATREMRMYAGLATELKGSSLANGADQFAYGLLEPYGVVGRIIPFNHPFKFAAGKSAPALVAGNSVILKPPEQASLSAIRLAELGEDLLPAGVFNVITGEGRRSGAAIAEHPDIPRVAFTGSVPTGKVVMRAAAERIKHVTLELGGKNPMIVCPDVDLDKAAGAAIKGMNFARSQGQSCQSTSRVYVHRDILSDFTDRVTRLAGALKVGDPLEEATDLGPLAFRSHYERVLRYIDIGLEEGATLLTGGKSALDRGYFVDPVVFGDVTQEMTIAREEIFGPVMSLLEWSNVEEVMAMANDTEFGLTAAIWTNDLSMAHRMAREIQAGYVWINGAAKRVPGTPFGGYKLSGIGKESSIEELLSYCRTKTIAVNI